MNIFKKTIKETQKIDKGIESFKETSATTPEPEEEWIWVEGYKGTDKDMKCRNFQYELGVQYDIPEGQKIQECESGFHLCLSFQSVFNYYNVGYGNRFFKVKALVRKTDKEQCQIKKVYYGAGDKLVAKSIIFTSELTCDEILQYFNAVKSLPENYKKLAIDISIDYAIGQYKIDTLIEDGYSEPFAAYITNIGKFEKAHALGSQNDLSMDVKVLSIFINT